ncbi:uncharacterized protein LOC135597909 [Musa acuminata AAA Group]|uniref:uncharacterized protein LOC135597909 n=1 Tax=Musa acuminata AAA Group TaxID=214697 RepID=UPI0031DCA6FA
MTASATNAPATAIPTRVLATELSLEWADGVVDGEAVEFLVEDVEDGRKLVYAGGGGVFIWVGVAGGGAAVVEGAGVEVDGGDRAEPGGVVCVGGEGGDGVEIGVGGAVTTTGASGGGGGNLESDAGVGGGDDAGRGGGGGDAES